MADSNVVCTAAGAGVWPCGGYAGSPASIMLTVKDSAGKKIPNWGGQIVVKVVPAAEVGGSNIDGAVNRGDDGTYFVTYVVPKEGNYMVNVECDGVPIIGSPFPVFFNSAGCKLKDRKYTSLISKIEPKRGTRVPVAQPPTSICAAKAFKVAEDLQVLAAQHDAQSQSPEDSTGASEKDEAEDEAEMLERTIQVSNLYPNVTSDQLKRIFCVRGDVLACTIVDPEHFAYIKFSKPQHAKIALALNNANLGDRPMKVEMAKSLPPELASEGEEAGPY